MKRSIAIFLGVLFALVSQSVQGLQISEPLWVIGPGKKSVKVPDIHGKFHTVKVNTSNNNVGISHFEGRIYFAFRTALHHHPTPPPWSPQFFKFDFSDSKMFVLSFPENEIWLKEKTWRYEFEAGSFLKKSLEKVQKSAAGIQELYGKEIAKEITALQLKKDKKASEGFLNSLFERYDLREPMFLEKDGQLHFYFQQLQGKFLSFNPLRTWKVTWKGDRWSEPTPVLKPGELIWDMRKVLGTPYLTSYSGAHYNGSGKAQIHFRRSVDGFKWPSVHPNTDAFYEGGANETSFEIDGDGRLWAIARNDDGGTEDGWGSILFTTEPWDWSNWKKVTPTSPFRFDSPRMISHEGEIYLIARQNIGYRIPGFRPEKNTIFTNLRRPFFEAGRGNILYDWLNYPFDLAFTNKRGEIDMEGGYERRRKNIHRLLRGKASNKSLNPFELGFFYQYESHFYFKQPKRTALYRLNRKTNEFDLLETLPSAGDTAFPSVIELGNGRFLVANYSSAFSKAEIPWGQGQQESTGIYFLEINLDRPSTMYRTGQSTWSTEDELGSETFQEMVN